MKKITNIEKKRNLYRKQTTKLNEIDLGFSSLQQISHYLFQIDSNFLLKNFCSQLFFIERGDQLMICFFAYLNMKIQ
jgi:hypothetical protein